MADKDKNVQQVNVDANNPGLKYHAPVMLVLGSTAAVIFIALAAWFIITYPLEAKILFWGLLSLGLLWLVWFVGHKMWAISSETFGAHIYNMGQSMRNKIKTTEAGTMGTWSDQAQDWIAHTVQHVNETRQYNREPDMQPQASYQQKPPPGKAALMGNGPKDWEDV